MIFLEYTRSLLCLYVRDMFKAVVLNSYSGQNNSNVYPHGDWDDFRCYCRYCESVCLRSLIASRSGSYTSMCSENKRIEKGYCGIGIPYCPILPCRRLFWLRCSYAHSFFPFSSSFYPTLLVIKERSCADVWGGNRPQTSFSDSSLSSLVLLPYKYI